MSGVKLTTRIVLVTLLISAMAPIAARAMDAKPDPLRTEAEASPLQAGLPVVELAVDASDSDVLSLILSGDGGWADLDRDFGEAFQARGVATVGFDCLKYFWRPRSQAEISRDLERILRHYLKKWRKRRLLLVGYSFGASWLALLVNHLPSDLQHQVSLVVLLAPGRYANLEIKVGDWLHDVRRPGALEVDREAAAIRPPLLCVYGTKERDDSLCPQLGGAAHRILEMPGGHHFDQQYEPIEETILRYFQ